MATTLYYNGATLDGGTRWLLVDGERIGAIGAGDPPPADMVVDLGGELLLPGLINAHHHLYSALAGRLDWPPRPADFTEILRQIWWRLDRALDEPSIRASARLALAASATQGVTTVIDHHSSPMAAAGSLDILAEEAGTLGMKIALALEVSDRDGADVFRDCIEENLRAIDRYAGGETTAALFGLHAGFTLSDESLLTCVEATSAPFHLHCAEGEADLAHAQSLGYGGVVDRLETLCVLRPGSLLAHGIHLMPGEAERIAEAGAFVAHCPQSNAHNGVGETDVESLLAAGVTVGLGSDGFLGSMLGEAHSSPAGAKTAAGLLYEGNAAIASSVFGRPVGRLQPGADADFITLAPSDSGLGLRRTVSRGRVLFDGERILGVEMEELEALAEEQSARLAERLQTLGGA